MQDSDMTPPLEVFRLEYQVDPMLWWKIGCGHHLNLFEMACDQLDEFRGASEEADRLAAENMRMAARLTELGESW